MPIQHWWVVFVSALIPMVIGTVWYNQKVFGTAWMKAIGKTPEDMKGVSIPKIMAVSLIYYVMIALMIPNMVIHQMGLMSSLMNQVGFGQPGTESTNYFMEYMLKYGREFRTFGHGAFHGVISGVFLGFPLIGLHALYDGRSFKYVLIHVGYWVVCLALMGGVICQFA